MTDQSAYRIDRLHCWDILALASRARGRRSYKEAWAPAGKEGGIRDGVNFE